jgi:hypothetical protein
MDENRKRVVENRAIGDKKLPEEMHALVDRGKNAILQTQRFNTRK